MTRFILFRLFQAFCSCHDLQHPTPKTRWSTLIPCCRLIQEKHLFFLSWKLFFVHFIVILKFVTWCGNIFFFLYVLYLVLGGGGEESANQHIYHWLTRSLLMGFILHMFIILFTTGSLLWSGWMLLFIQNRCTLSDSHWVIAFYMSRKSVQSWLSLDTVTSVSLQRIAIL